MSCADGIYPLFYDPPAPSFRSFGLSLDHMNLAMAVCAALIIIAGGGCTLFPRPSALRTVRRWIGLRR